MLRVGDVALTCKCAPTPCHSRDVGGRLLVDDAPLNNGHVESNVRVTNVKGPRVLAFVQPCFCCIGSVRPLWSVAVLRAVIHALYFIPARFAWRI